MKKQCLSEFALVLLIIGGLNWGLVGLFNLDLVSWFFGEVTLLSNSIYLVIAVAALYKLIFLLRRCCAHGCLMAKRGKNEEPKDIF